MALFMATSQVLQSRKTRSMSAQHLHCDSACFPQRVHFNVLMVASGKDLNRFGIVRFILATT